MFLADIVNYRTFVLKLHDVSESKSGLAKTNDRTRIVERLLKHTHTGDPRSKGHIQVEENPVRMPAAVLRGEGALLLQPIAPWTTQTFWALAVQENWFM